MSNISWSFAGSTVLVTGASRGIGFATANLFAEAGAHVFALSRTAGTEGLHPAAHAIRADVTSTESLIRAARSAAALTGRVDICVANAGAVLIEEFATTNASEWSRLVEVNLLGVMRSWQVALSHMTADGRGGRLIATSSAAGVRGEPDAPAYSATKAAISGLVQALAVEYAEHKITVNAVAPGEIDTLLNRQGRAEAAHRQAKRGEEIRDSVSEPIPARRLGRPDEIAALIAFLASSESDYITGQTILIDGGQLLV